MLGTIIIPAGLFPPNLASDLVGTDEFLVLVDDWAAETGLEDHDRGEDEAGTDFDEGEFRRCFVVVVEGDGFGFGFGFGWGGLLVGGCWVIGRR